MLTLSPLSPYREVVKQKEGVPMIYRQRPPRKKRPAGGSGTIETLEFRRVCDEVRRYVVEAHAKKIAMLRIPNVISVVFGKKETEIFYAGSNRPDFSLHNSRTA